MVNSDAGNKIGKISIQGVISEFPIPTSGSGTWGITAGPDGNVWFTEGKTDKIGRVTTSGIFTEFPLPTLYNFPLGITAGPDSKLWFTEPNGNKIGYVRPSTRASQSVRPLFG